MADIPTNSGTTRPSNQTAATRQIVGIAFPFSKGNGEFPKRLRDGECVKNDLFTLFKTSARSRVMRPLVGHHGADAVFDSKGSALIARLQRIIRQTIFNNETRVKILSISISGSNTQVISKVDYVTQGIRDDVTLPIIGS